MKEKVINSEKFRNMETDSNSASVIVSTFNRVAYLKKCIAALLKLNFENFEIIIVNDGSIDGTREYLNKLHDKKIKVIHHKKNLGLGQARNSGIRLSKYEIIAFTDDDCVVDKDWLKEILKSFNNKNIGLVIGQTFYIKKNYRGYFPERLVQNIGAKWPMGCNVAYRKKVFDQIGYFDNSFFKYTNEDSEMAIRTIVNGFSFNRSLGAIVYHQPMDWTVKSLLKSARNASVWPLLKKKYPDYYLMFKPPIKYGIFVNIQDYLYILTLPIFIPLLLIRYILHRKYNLKLFFTKWPIYLFLRRYYIYKEAIKNKVLMI